jgi:hypothetical protein
MKGKRSNVDFSQHILTEKEEGGTLIHRFARPNSGTYAITFINTCGIMAVTGDLGNWIFCREFHPSSEGEVSDGYWLEKLRISSTQKPTIFSAEETKKEINEMLSDPDRGLNDEEKEYLNELLGYADEDEMRYLVYAHDNIPSRRDFEFVPAAHELTPWLRVVFDAFDEICRRMKQS